MSTPFSRLILGVVLGAQAGMAAAADGMVLHCPRAGEAVRMIVVGDTRTPNPPEKPLLTQRIIAERPDLFFHLGDMVRDAGENHWRHFDHDDARIRQAGIPFVPMLGNHEYRTMPFFIGDPLAGYFQRFPELDGAHWYQYRCGPLRLVILDTEYSLTRGSLQRSWLERVLGEKKEGVVIVGLHRPPRTGYPGYEVPLAGELTALFGKAGVDLVVSGHVHNYERFLIDGVPHVVTGGGGSPLYEVTRRPDDLYHGGNPGLHYVRVVVTAQGFTAEMVNHDPVSRGFVTGDAFQGK